MYLKGLILFFSLLVISCSQFGPDFMKAGRNEYNKVLAQTDDEEILLNLIRLRYADNPTFLKVSSVSTAFNWKEGFGINGSIFEGLRLQITSEFEAIRNTSKNQPSLIRHCRVLIL